MSILATTSDMLASCFIPGVLCFAVIYIFQLHSSGFPTFSISLRLLRHYFHLSSLFLTFLSSYSILLSTLSSNPPFPTIFSAPFLPPRSSPLYFFFHIIFPLLPLSPLPSFRPPPDHSGCRCNVKALGKQALH